MYEGPEFRHLTHFIALAEECNFGRAATKIHTTQPNLTRSINQLEDGMGVSLFNRSNAGSGLTAAGRALLPFARNLLNLRTQAVKATSTKHSGIELPLRFGYSPFINHDLVSTAMDAFCELVPEGKIDPTSECSGDLLPMILGGELEAALVSLPIDEEGLFVQRIRSENILVCLRADDPLAQEETVPRSALNNRLSIIFARAHHPLFYDKLLKKLMKAGITLKPSSFVSAPSELQYLVETRKGLGLIRDSTPLSKHLVTRPIADLSLRVTTAFVCKLAQQRPVLQLLAYNLAQRYADAVRPEVPKKPSGRVTESPTQSGRSAA